MEVWAYVFVTTREPKRVLRAVRLMTGVIHADALLGSPDVIAIVSGSNIGELDSVIDRVAETALRAEPLGRRANESHAARLAVL